jgi:apolipoprotein N-acyltransferase
MYLDLSAAHTDRDLIVWPEAALPFYLDELPPDFWAALDRHPAHFVVGILERRTDDGVQSDYNSILAVADGRALYRKAHLVPFGEYLPFPLVLSWLIDYLKIPMSDFSAWEGFQETIEVAGVPASTSICYEDAFQDEVRRSLDDAVLMINVSEDSWFGDSLAPHQRLDMARMRALENGRPMVRAGNSGISAVIDHAGNITARTPQFRRVVLLAEVQPTRGVNPFTLFGSWPTVILCSVIAVLSWPLRRR